MKADMLHLGLYSGDGDTVWTCAKWLELCRLGTVIRNVCAIGDPLTHGVWFIKVGTPFTETGSEWLHYDPKTGQRSRSPNDGVPIHSRDIFLPVQVMTPKQVIEAAEAQ